MNRRLPTTHAKASQGLCAFVRAGLPGSLVVSATLLNHWTFEDRSSPGDSCA